MRFANDMWNKLIEKISATFRLNATEKRILNKNRVAKLIAAISYIADCEDPERTALAHLGTYLIARDPACKKVFGHNPEDNTDPLKRMAPLTYFRGGKKALIDRGIALLALIQLQDHKKDLDEDHKNGKYNPILAGAWHFESERKRLFALVSKISCPEMDAVASPIDIDSWDT